MSLLAPGQPVRGYDTGPGNMLLDAWIWRQKGKPYDKDAQWASEGKVLLPLLQDMLSDPWFALPAPKSTGREYFNYGWLEQHMARYPGLRGEDVQATLAELTAVTISEQVLLSGGCERLLVCGGGARNPLLMARLAALLPGTEVSTTDEAGISAMMGAARCPAGLANAGWSAGQSALRDRRHRSLGAGRHFSG